MIATIYLTVSEIFGHNPVGKRRLEDVLKMFYQEKQHILPRHFAYVQNMS